MTINFLANVEEFFTSILEILGLAWWIEVVTYNPCCTYYFGPFATNKEAKLSQAGYIEDLEGEKAQILAIEIKQGRPKELTICEDEWQKSLDGGEAPAISHIEQSHTPRSDLPRAVTAQKR
jgi:hypothetical protein